jgi:hypothetical protein
MWRVYYRILLSFLIFLTFYGCGGTDARDKMKIAFNNWSEVTYSGLDTLKVNVHFWTPYKDNADYDFYFDGMINSQIKFTSPVVTKYDLSYSNDDRSLSLSWIGFVPSDNYDLCVWFKKMTGEIRAVDSTFDMSDSAAAIVDTSEYTLVKWCGDKRYGNSGDTVMYPAAYPIHVRTINQATGKGVNNKDVSFSTIPGDLWYTQPYTINASIPYGDENLDGMAFTHLIISSGVTNYTVTATCGSQSVTFDLMGVIDNEVVTNDTLKIHECWDSTTTRQISGDGYWGTNDPDNNKKNLKLEVDYDMSVVSQTTLQNALNLLRDSLYSQVGIDVSYVIDNTFSSGYITRSMEKQLLAQNRNVNYKGIGKGYLHVLFASIFENNDTLCGRAVTYRDPDQENIGGTTCAYLGSGDLSITGHSQYYLDSVGCMVYVSPSCRTIPSTFIDSAHVLALIAAHEIGHAIGLGHLDATTADSLKGIMSAEFKIDSTMSYTKYAYFAKPTSDDYVNRWLINLRKFLGRETVDFMW